MQEFISVWEKQEEGAEKDLLKRACLLAEKFTTNGIGCDVLGEKEIVRLLNLVNNPSYTHLEDTEFESCPVYVESIALLRNYRHRQVRLKQTRD